VIPGLQEAATLIRAGRRFLLTCHVQPDADAIGSMLALAEILKALGKEVVLYNRDPVPEMLRFLTGTQQIESRIPADVRFDAMFITDTAARSLLPRKLPPRSVTGPCVVLDHHVAHDDFGDIVVRDVTAAATANVVIELARVLQLDPLPVSAAEPLYTALVADTGNFRYPGTSSQTLRLAATLIDSGVDPWRVARQVFENWPLPRLRLLGLAIEAIELERAGRIAVLCVPQSLIERAGAHERMVEGFVEYGRMIKGVQISIMLWEQKSSAEDTDGAPVTSRLSLRGDGQVDVSAIAVTLGGGGHRAAAGATLQCDLPTARARVLDAAIAVLEAAVPASP
jgi:bifunctional oligoribonuclease and PAP phosphatase NrnA